MESLNTFAMYLYCWKAGTKAVIRVIYCESGVISNGDNTLRKPLRFSYPSYHDDVIKWKHFPRYWPFVRGIHRSPVASGAELWCFLGSAPEQTVEQTIDTPAGDLRRRRAHYDITVMTITPKVYGGRHIANDKLDIWDHSGYGLSQLETTLYCNVVTHWLSLYPEWSLSILLNGNIWVLNCWSI